MLEDIEPEDIIITNGCMEAVALCLLATVPPGGTVAVEAPTNYSFLQLLKELNLMVAEVPTDPQTGLDIQALERLVHHTRIDACLFMPNFHNPLGCLMPDPKKEALVAYLNERTIPIIEDDIHGDLVVAIATILVARRIVVNAASETLLILSVFRRRSLSAFR